MSSRRGFLKGAAAGFVLHLLPVGSMAAVAAKFVDVRLWPADDYTRVTLEHHGALRYKYFVLENPWRMVVDILDSELDSTLKNLAERLEPNDPYVQRIRVGQFDENTVRIVFDLKAEVKPEVFSINPVADYQHRFVLDFYPAKPRDPLLSLLENETSETIISYREDEIQRALELAGVIDPAAPKVAKDGAAGSASTGPQGEAKKAVELPTDSSTVAKSAPTTSVQKAQPEVRRLVTVAIDPGHGGEDPGAVGKHGVKEKDVVLAIAKRLKKQIDAIPGMRAMLTRDGDYFVPLGRRVAKARAVKADLFVSVHADAFTKRTVKGSSVFVLSERGATSTAARWLADKENASDLIGGVNISGTDSQLAKVLLDLSTTAQISDSLKLGSAVLSQIGSVNALHKKHVEQAGFAVLKAPDIPSILIETAFISNPEEEKKLRDGRHQEKLATAIAGGIRAYFAKNPPVARSGIA